MSGNMDRWRRWARKESLHLPSGTVTLSGRPSGRWKKESLLDVQGGRCRQVGENLCQTIAPEGKTNWLRRQVGHTEWTSNFKQNAIEGDNSDDVGIKRHKSAVENRTISHVL